MLKYFLLEGICNYPHIDNFIIIVDKLRFRIAIDLRKATDANDCFKKKTRDLGSSKLKFIQRQMIDTLIAILHCRDLWRYQRNSTASFSSNIALFKSRVRSFSNFSNPTRYLRSAWNQRVNDTTCVNVSMIVIHEFTQRSLRFSLLLEKGGEIAFHAIDLYLLLIK